MNVFLKILILVVMNLVLILPVLRADEKSGQCVRISNGVYKLGTGYGYKMRLAVGKFKGTGHQWAEYWNEKRQKWCLWDNAIWYIGKSWYTAEETGYHTFYQKHHL